MALRKEHGAVGPARSTSDVLVDDSYVYMKDQRRVPESGSGDTGTQFSLTRFMRSPLL